MKGNTMKVLLADRVLAGPDLAPIDHGAVLVDGDTITWVGREADLTPDLHDPGADLVRLGD